MSRSVEAIARKRHPTAWKEADCRQKRQWRCRIGDYCLICQIDDNRLIILALPVGHRRDISIILIASAPFFVKWHRATKN